MLQSVASALVKMLFGSIASLVLLPAVDIHLAALCWRFGSGCPVVAQAVPRIRPWLGGLSRDSDQRVAGNTVIAIVPSNLATAWKTLRLSMYRTYTRH